MWDFLLWLQHWFFVLLLISCVGLLVLVIAAGLLNPKQPHQGDKADDEEEP